jgi:hypothetical protein
VYLRVDLRGGRGCHDCGTWKASGGPGAVRHINSFPAIIAALLIKIINQTDRLAKVYPRSRDKLNCPSDYRWCCKLGARAPRVFTARIPAALLPLPVVRTGRFRLTNAGQAHKAYEKRIISSSSAHRRHVTSTFGGQSSMHFCALTPHRREQ